MLLRLQWLYGKSGIQVNEKMPAKSMKKCQEINKKRSEMKKIFAQTKLFHQDSVTFFVEKLSFSKKICEKYHQNYEFLVLIFNFSNIKAQIQISSYKPLWNKWLVILML